MSVENAKPKHEETLLDKLKSTKRLGAGAGVLVTILPLLLDRNVSLVEMAPWALGGFAVYAFVALADDVVKTWRDVKVAEMQVEKKKNGLVD